MRRELIVVSLVSRHPGVPWTVKTLAWAVVAYALSPIDLIPDFIPWLGHLDDLILLPLGIVLVVKLVPRPILEECRNRAGTVSLSRVPGRWVAAAGVVALWALLAVGILAWIGTNPFP